MLRFSLARWAVQSALWCCALASVGCGQEPTGVAPCESASDCAPLDDGDPCTGVFKCAAGQCQRDTKSKVVCDGSADTPCSHSACDPADGACKATPRSDGLACDDGAPCTAGDVCKAGACKPGTTNLCACAKDADCADDGDACNGELICDLAAFPYRCVTKPGTEVTCAATKNACMTTLCEPKTGGCVTEAKSEGAACDDGDACTTGDVCAKGACEGGADACSCEVDQVCKDLDGDPCTGVPFCDKSGGKPVCKTNPATVVACSSKADTSCIKNQCSKTTGACTLTPVADATGCDDGDACTKGDTCEGGACNPGTDTCKCSGDKDCVDDGNKCNGLPFCDKSTGKCETNPATVVVCQTASDTGCAKNVCIPRQATAR